MKVEEAQQQIGHAVMAMARIMPPQAFIGFFSGAIATMVASLPDDYWRECERIEPCGEPGCNCHIEIKPVVISALKLLRDDYNKYGPAVQTVEE